MGNCCFDRRRIFAKKNYNPGQNYLGHQGGIHARRTTSYYSSFLPEQYVERKHAHSLCIHRVQNHIVCVRRVKNVAAWMSFNQGRKKATCYVVSLIVFFNTICNGTTGIFSSGGHRPRRWGSISKWFSVEVIVYCIARYVSVVRRTHCTLPAARTSASATSN